MLKGREAIQSRPGEHLKSINFEALKEQLYDKLGRQVTDLEIISAALYPKVF